MMEEIDEIQKLGETALTTLTQLWRQLPRLNTEAGAKFGDQVVQARKAIERLVRIACEGHHAPAPTDPARLYEPLPFGTVAHGEKRKGSPARSSEGERSGSVPGTPQRRPSFPTVPEGVVAAAANASAARRESGTTSGDEGKETPPRGTRRASGTASGSNSPAKQQSEQRHHHSKKRETQQQEQQVSHIPSNAQMQADYERLKKELNVPAGVNFFDDPAWTEMLQSYQRMTSGTSTTIDPTHLALIVQLAMRREFMWRMHARTLQCQGDRDALGEIETRARCEIEIATAFAREELLAEMQGVKLSAIADGYESVNDAPEIQQQQQATAATESAAAAAAIATGGVDGSPASSPNGTAATSSPLSTASSTTQRHGSDRKPSKRAKSRVLENIRQTFEIEKERHDTEVKFHALESDKQKLVVQMGELASRISTMSLENTTLQKKAEAEMQTIPPEQLAALKSEIEALRQQVAAQEEELKVMGL